MPFSSNNKINGKSCSNRNWEKKKFFFKRSNSIASGINVRFCCQVVGSDKEKKKRNRREEKKKKQKRKKPERTK